MSSSFDLAALAVENILMVVHGASNPRFELSTFRSHNERSIDCTTGPPKNYQSVLQKVWI